MKMSVLKLLKSPRCHSHHLNTIRSNKPSQINVYSTAAENEEVIIPKRIPRGPTDILKALASVTKRDPTAAHYKYHDDPYLIPYSNSSKRIYALAQESGRKAAMWIKEEHPELFQHIEAEPPIEAFLARAQYDETDDLDNELLAKIIKSSAWSDAVTVYNIMKKRGDEISDENKQALLELVSFFNETEEINPELIEEKWFSQSNKNSVVKKTWKDNGFAWQLFEELPESAESYSAIILGMTKYFQVEKAFEYFKLAEAKGFTLSVDAYNSLIHVSFFMAGGTEKRWELIENILTTMNDHGLKPTLRTLNSVLYCLSRSQSGTDNQRHALKMIAEVKRFGVVPSLATYYHLLNIFYVDKTTRSYVLENILEDLESRQLTIQDPQDVNFFSLAMEKCRYYLGDKDIAHRINRLLWHGDNYNFIGNSFLEAAYYRNYFHLLFQTEVLEDIIKIYDYLVPHIYTPEMSVLEEFIKCATMNGAVELYQRIWTEAVQFDLYNKLQIINALLDGMVLNRSPLTVPPSPTAIMLSDVAWSIYQKLEQKSFNRLPIEWTGKLLGNIMLLLLHADKFTEAKIVLKKLIKDENSIIGVPESEVFPLYIDACIRHDDLKEAMNSISYCSYNGYEVKELGKKLVKGMTLSPAIQTQLTAIAGADILKDDAESINDNTS